MQFRRSLADPRSYDWITDIRKEIECAQSALTDMMDNRPGTIKKDRNDLAEAFHALAQVPETETVRNTAFAPDVVSK